MKMKEKEIRERRKCDPHLVSAGTLAHGPEVSVLGLGGHDTLLSRLMAAEGPQHFGEIRPKFLFEYDGKFARRPINDGVRTVRIYRDGHAGAEIGVSLTTMKLPQEAFRRRLAELMLEGSKAICVRAAKKKLTFEAENFMDFMHGIVNAYLAVPLPLPVTRAEAEMMHDLVGIPVEPCEE